MKNLIFLRPVLVCMFVLIASIAIGYSTPPIGYEYIGVNNHLHTWNQNPLGEDKSNIWFDGRSGYTQFFNGANQSEAIERSEWLTQGFGLGYYDGNNDFQFISQDFLNNPNHNVETDNTTYWQQQVWKCVNNPADFCGGWIRNQSLNSTLLMNAFMFRVRPQDSPFSFPFKLYYLWTFEDINITNTSTVDMIIYCNMTNHNDSYLLNLTTIERCDKIYLNNPSQIIVGNLTQFHIVDSQTLAGH